MMINIIDRLIESGVNINSRDSGLLMNALGWLCTNSYKGDHSATLEVAKFLIEKGIDTNAQDSQGWNALHCLCFHWYNIQGRVQVIKKGTYYVENLCYDGKYGVELAKMLIENGIEVNAKTKDDGGHNALHFILFAWDHTFDALEMAKMLVIEKGIDINSTSDWRGDTALHYLFRNYKGGSKTLIAKLLVDRGINVSIKNKDGMDALSYLKNDVSYMFGEKADDLYV